MVKTMSFEVATQEELVATAYIKNAKLIGEWKNTLEFASEEAAIGMYNALKDNGYDMTAVHCEGNTLAFAGMHTNVEESDYRGTIKVEWYVDTFHHIQCEEGIAGFVKRAKRTFRKN